MKKAVLTIEFEQEKLDAIRYFSEQKSADIQDEAASRRRQILCA